MKARVDTSFIGLLLSLAVLGCFTGFFAGLLGIGGGMLLVPFMTLIFTAQAFPAEHIIRMAVATSLTTILFTSISSVRAHHKRGAVRWELVKPMGLGAIIGTLLGALIAGGVRSHWLGLLFGVVVSFAALQMLLPKKNPNKPESIPSQPVLGGVGGLIGSISSFVGAGGGFITVPFLTSRGVQMHQTIATSAAMGFPIAAGGLVGYILAGVSVQGLPSGTLGFVYLPALIACAATSVLFAPLGAKLAHSLPTAQLKKIFAFVLFTLAAYMAYKGLRGLV